MTTKLDSLAKYSNPFNLSYNYVELIENKLLGNEGELLDNNSVFGFTIDMNATMNAHLINEVCNVVPSLYPARVQTSEELYKHLSDNEFIGIFANPALTELEILLDKQYLIANAESYNTNYNKVVIPKSSTFKLDDFIFGIYYPIEIRINKHTKTFQISYDTTTYGNNPLHTLNQNTIEHRIINYKGLELLSFKLPIYQFETVTQIENIIKETGFIKSYNYLNSFYAIRIYNYIDGEWIEIKKTLSDKIYDPKELTAKITIKPDIQKINIIIPQIYFDDDKVGNKIKVEMFNTLGELDIQTSTIEDTITVNFVSQNPDIQRYANIFKNIKVMSALVCTNRILGGSNSTDFELLRSMVIDNSFYNKVLTTPADIDIWLKNKGFSNVEHCNGILKRIYYCFRKLTDDEGDTIAASSLATNFTLNILKDVDTIVDNENGTYVILPNTLYKYNNVKNIAEILSNDEVHELENLPRLQKIDAYNDNIYTVSPLYTRINTNTEYPFALSYNLDSPKINTINFIAENIEIITQLTVVSAQISCKEKYAGYKIELTISKTADIKDITHDRFKIYCNTGVDGTIVYTEAIYIEKVDDYDLYEIDLSSNYNINDDFRLLITNLLSINSGDAHYIPLTFDLDLVFLIDKTVLKPGPSNEGTMRRNLPIDKYLDYIALSEQTLNIKLGHTMSGIYNKLDLSYTDKQYAKYKTNEYATYSGDVLEYKDNLPVYDRSVKILSIQTMDYTKGSKIITPRDITILAVGYFLSNKDFPFYTYIVSIDTENNTITINNEALEDGSSEVEIGEVTVNLKYIHRVGDWIFNENTVLKAIAQVVIDETTVTVDDVTGVEIGMKISGNGIAPMTSIINIDNLILTLDNKNIDTVTDSPVEMGIPELIHKKGDVILDEFGNPILDIKRQEIYYTDKIHIDAKLLLLTGLETVNYQKVITGLLDDYNVVTDELTKQLYENTRAFYKPIRSLGDATFIIDGNKNVILPLEISLALKLYVYDFVYGNAILLNQIKEVCINLVEESLENKEFSLTLLSKKIINSMPDYVKTVDILGINNNIQLQTLMNNEENVLLVLKRELRINDENQIVLEKSLDISYVSIEK